MDNAELLANLQRKSRILKIKSIVNRGTIKHKTPIRSHLVIKNKHCGVKMAETGQFVLVAALRSDMAETSEEIQKFFSEKSPHYSRNDLLSKAPDGIYNWIFYESLYTPLKFSFICVQVLSPFELGTLHNSLASTSSLNVKKVWGGGELKKKYGVIREFNTQSGTFMKTASKEHEDAIIDIFQASFPGAEYKATSSMISSINTIPRTVLKDYMTYFHCIVLLFNTLDECKMIRDKIDTITDGLKDKTLSDEQKNRYISKLEYIYQTYIMSKSYNSTIRKAITYRSIYPLGRSRKRR
jgi:hypothetical protein